MKKYFYFFFLIPSFISCSKSEKKIAGVYVKSPSHYTIDTLFVYADSLQPTLVYNRKVYKYMQRFYNKSTGQILFENRSTWWINDNGRLELDNLYLDGDNNPENYSYSPVAIKNAVISSSLPLKSDKIIVNEDEGVFYLKVK
ncbi:MAG: hypothetical protein QM725_13225 [Lacibacter sp.]